MITLRDIAEELGLHPSTASRAIAGKPGVSEEMRALVLETARRLHYQPNALARGLRAGQNRVVGLVFPDVLNELYSSTATVLAAMLASHGYLTHLSITYDDKTAEREAVRSLAEHQVSGLIIASCGPRDATVSRMLASVPVVEFMRGTRAKTDKVLWDDEAAAYAATEHLIGLGHRDLRFITGVPTVTTTVARVAGFRRALREAGIEAPAGWIHYGRTVAEWQQAAKRVAREAQPATAVIASNHLIALDALAALETEGLRVPADVSLVGLDDPSWFWAVGNGITGVAMPWDQMAHKAGAFLLDRMNQRDGVHARSRSVTTRFPATLVVRGSTSTPRALPVVGAARRNVASAMAPR